jgi:predicted glycosyltransferase
VKFLFQIWDRRGLGHLVRGSNLATAILELAPQARIRFCALREAPSDWPLPPVEWVHERDAERAPTWREELATYQPEVAVYDTVLPKPGHGDVDHGRARIAYVMRRSKDERQSAVVAHPLVAKAALVIVPHSESEFGHALPAELRARTLFAGPIVRKPDAAARELVRERYAIASDAFTLVSTPGGGGFEEHARNFFRRVFAIHAAVSARVPRLRHIAVCGPRFASPLAAPAGVELVETEPRMPELLSLADLAIAEGGYNTVHELRAAQTPAVFLPSPRSHDDQYERVQALAAAGLGLAFAEEGDERIAAEVASLCADPARLAAMRARHAAERFEPGNQAAARALVQLASQAR